MSDIKQRLEAAADYLDRIATEAEYVPGRFIVDVAGPVASTMWLGPTHDVLTATVPQAALVDSIGTPTAARLVAKILRFEAADVAMCDAINSRDPDNDGKTRVMYRDQTSYALELADHILKEKK